MSEGASGADEDRTGSAREARRASLDFFNALRREAEAGKHKKIVFAESCTGGLLSALFTEIPGSSEFLWGGFVVYSVEAKIALLGLERGQIERDGVVSTATAAAMARGALERSEAELAVAITGYAGPDVDPGEEGPGRVAFGWAAKNRTETAEERFTGSRNEIRFAAAARAYRGALELLCGSDERY
jgi:PncC family amidohydrolase